MGMSKEQLKEMIDNVIVSNGKGQITADALNLVLNNIAENAGGGSIKILFFTAEMVENDDYEFFEPFFNHNSEIYNAIIEKYMALMQADPNADELLSNIVNILNDGFFKAYDTFEYYYPMEFFSAYSYDFYINGVENDSESNEIIVKFYNKNNYDEWGLYPNGELISLGGGPS